MTKRDVYAVLLGMDATGALFAALVGSGSGLAIFLIAGTVALAGYLSQMGEKC